MIEGSINTMFGTFQADIFESGLVAEIGGNAFTVWCAIKAHANFKTGACWPGVRRLMALTGLASATVQRALKSLESSHLLRSKVQGQRRVYVARERLDVKLGERTLCTIVVDYVPNTLRKKLSQIEDMLQTGEKNPDVFANVDIIPGLGFTWDQTSGVLRATIQVVEISRVCESASTSEADNPLVQKVLNIRRKLKSKAIAVPKE